MCQARIVDILKRAEMYAFFVGVMSEMIVERNDERCDANQDGERNGAGAEEYFGFYNFRKEVNFIS